jgi:hypothetical protein
MSNIDETPEPIMIPVPGREELFAVVRAACAEVRAQGYRSTDMATALENLLGRWWYESLDPEWLDHVPHT